MPKSLMITTNYVSVICYLCCCSLPKPIATSNNTILIKRVVPYYNTGKVNSETIKKLHKKETCLTSTISITKNGLATHVSYCPLYSMKY